MSSCSLLRPTYVLDPLLLFQRLSSYSYSWFSFTSLSTSPSSKHVLDSFVLKQNKYLILEISDFLPAIGPFCLPPFLKLLGYTCSPPIHTLTPSGPAPVRTTLYGKSTCYDNRRISMGWACPSSWSTSLASMTLYSLIFPLSRWLLLLSLLH